MYSAFGYCNLQQHVEAEKLFSIFDKTTNNQGFDQGEAILLGKEAAHPLLITEGRKKEYPGSDLVIEETLPSGTLMARQKKIPNFGTPFRQILAFRIFQAHYNFIMVQPTHQCRGSFQKSSPNK